MALVTRIERESIAYENAYFRITKITRPENTAKTPTSMATMRINLPESPPKNSGAIHGPRNTMATQPAATYTRTQEVDADKSLSDRFIGDCLLILKHFAISARLIDALYHSGYQATRPFGVGSVVPAYHAR